MHLGNLIFHKPNFITTIPILLSLTDTGELAYKGSNASPSEDRWWLGTVLCVSFSIDNVGWVGLP